VIAGLPPGHPERTQRSKDLVQAVCRYLVATHGSNFEEITVGLRDVELAATRLAAVIGMVWPFSDEPPPEVVEAARGAFAARYGRGARVAEIVYLPEPDC
jgi:hypothetical protein